MHQRCIRLLFSIILVCGNIKLFVSSEVFRGVLLRIPFVWDVTIISGVVVCDVLKEHIFLFL